MKTIATSTKKHAPRNGAGYTDAYHHAMCHVNEAKAFLVKARKYRDYYTHPQYVRMAGNTLWNGVMVALESKYNLGKAKGCPDMDKYRDLVGHEDEHMLKVLNSNYIYCSLAMGYDGNLHVRTSAVALEDAISLIQWATHSQRILDNPNTKTTQKPSDGKGTYYADAYHTAIQCVDEAKATLVKARKYRNYYTHAQYVRLAGNILWNGVMVALESKYNLEESKGTTDIIKYQELVGHEDEHMLKVLNSGYHLCNMAMGCDGDLTVSISKAALEKAMILIEWAARPNS